MAYTADVNRWRGPVEEPYRPHMLDSPWHPGWIAVTILGFIIWWPIGLALLIYTLGSRKMACWGHSDRWQNKMERMQWKMERMKNRMERGVDNVRFLKGHIEQIPLPDESVDVVISNCVINLSGDKPSVLREAFRVLKPGGRFAVSDVVVQGELPPALRQSMELFVGCIAGALEEDTYRNYE